MIARVTSEKTRRSLFAAAAQAGCIATIENEWFWNGDIFDADMVADIRERAPRMGYALRDIKSQVGYDAYHLAAHCPTAMIFAPCVDGITHYNKECCAPEDLLAPLNVLLRAIVARADR